MRPTTEAEAGFSLVELTVAMTITVVISGAVYGLMGSGQNAFRREPEMTDRQQNIRVGMDLIMRDIEGAGVGLPPFVQTFTQGLNATSDSPTGASGTKADELEILTNTNQRGNEPACSDNGPNDPQVRLVGLSSQTIPIGAPLLVLFQDGTYTMRAVTGVQTDNGGPGPCQNGQHTRVQFDTGQDTTGLNNAGGICQPNALGIGNAGCGCSPTPSGCASPLPTTCDCVARELSFAELIRWRIRNAADGLPELQRYSTSALATDPANPWRTVARGIEDLQIQYTQAAGALTTAAPGAPQVTPNNYGSIVTQVRVTLWARATGNQAGLSGLTNAPGGNVVPAALRGSLTSVAVPHAALYHISADVSASPSPAPIWR